jgi:hypothetical protein
MANAPDPDSLANERLATDMLLSVSERARIDGKIALSALQGLANMRAVAGGRFQLTEEAVRESERSIQVAQHVGELDWRVRTLDSGYLQHLRTPPDRSEVAASSSGPRTLREFVAQPVHPDALDPSKDVFDTLGKRARSQAACLSFASVILGLGLVFVWVPLGVVLLALGALGLLGSIKQGRPR